MPRYNAYEDDTAENAYQDEPDDEDTGDTDGGDYVELDDPADWPVCHPLYSPQPRD